VTVTVVDVKTVRDPFQLNCKLLYIYINKKMGRGRRI
jgi:hypothetical protein